MRAVCTRGRFEGGWEQPTLARVCVCTHTRRVEDPSSFSLRATAERIHPRAKKLYYFGGKILFFDPPPILLLSRLLFSLSSFFFSNRPPSFPDRARLPAGKGWKPRERERGETSSPLHSRDSQPDSLLFLSLLSCACILQFLLLQSCNCARCKVD